MAEAGRGGSSDGLLKILFKVSNTVNLTNYPILFGMQKRKTFSRGGGEESKTSIGNSI